jgi:alkanesulfonate monooxygenase SsuD/methylene tetrahydromethanopterin reductase-like flavin-dependent oxidoreductase (luciferase family)
MLILADDPDEAWSTIAPHQKWIAETYGHVAATVGGALAERFATEVDPDTLRQRSGVPGNPRLDVVTPREAIERIRPWAATRPLEYINFLGDIAGLPDDLLDRHLELVATHLVGAFEGLQPRVTGP